MEQPRNGFCKEHSEHKMRLNHLEAENCRQWESYGTMKKDMDNKMQSIHNKFIAILTGIILVLAGLTVNLLVKL